MDVIELGEDDGDEAVALWHATGLTRAWNPPLDDFSRAVAGPASAVLGIREPALVGTAMVGHDGHRGWLYYLAVAPHRQRRGLGAALLGAAEAWIVERGGVKLQLMVRADNDAAAGFYRALGYADQDVRVLGRRL